MQNVLRPTGFEVMLKPFIQRADGSAKGGWGAGITLDAIEYAALACVMVLVSGDGDFDLQAQKIREVHGKRVEVYGVPKLTGHSLINAVSQFIPIEAICYWIDELMCHVIGESPSKILRLKKF